MKKILTLMLVLSCFGMFGQGNLAVKVSPLTIFKGQLLMAHVEYNFADNYTVGLGLAPVISGSVVGGLAYPPSQFNGGIAIDPEFRMYAKKGDAMDGFFVGLYNSTRISGWQSDGDSNWSGESYDVRNTVVIGGFQLGVHRLMGDHFSVDLYSGLGLRSNKITAKQQGREVEVIQAGGVNFRLNVAVGYQF